MNRTALEELESALRITLMAKMDDEQMTKGELMDAIRTVIRRDKSNRDTRR